MGRPPFLKRPRPIRKPSVEISYEVLDPPHQNGSKYRLTKSHYHALRSYEPGASAMIGPWVNLSGNLLFLREGYCWDGATGPAIDTPDFMTGSLVHDALYQLIGHGALPKKPWKRHADNELCRICKRAGMPFPRRGWVWLAVRLFGGADGRYET